MWNWDFSGRIMGRSGTLKADNRDLNLASATLTAELRFSSRMETIRCLDRKFVSMGSGMSRVWHGGSSINVCFLLLDIL